MSATININNIWKVIHWRWHYFTHLFVKTKDTGRQLGNSHRITELCITNSQLGSEQHITSQLHSRAEWPFVSSLRYWFVYIRALSGQCIDDIYYNSFVNKWQNIQRNICYRCFKSVNVWGLSPAGPVKSNMHIVQNTDI